MKLSIFTKKSTVVKNVEVRNVCYHHVPINISVS